MRLGYAKYFRAWGQFVEGLSWTWVAQQTITKYLAKTVMNLVAPKAAAKDELLFNKPTPDLNINKQVWAFNPYWKGRLSTIDLLINIAVL